MEKYWTEEQARDLARPLAKKMPEIMEFYSKRENREAYRRWHIEQFGCEPTGGIYGTYQQNN